MQIQIDLTQNTVTFDDGYLIVEGLRNGGEYQIRFIQDLRILDSTKMVFEYPKQLLPEHFSS